MTGLRVVGKKEQTGLFSITHNHGDLIPLTNGWKLYNYVDVMEGRLPWKDTEEPACGP